MTDSNPSINDLAHLAEASYTGGSYKDYQRQEELSNPQISTFYHPNKKHYVVSHRGTDLTSPTVNKDVKADLRILIGDKNKDSLHRARVGQTEDIYKAIREKSNEPIHLVGHSLGGSTTQHALIKSQVVRENTASHNTFNAGSSPLQYKGINPKHKNYKAIAKISTHHSIEGDPVSASIKDSMIGTIKSYNTKQNPTVSQKILQFVKPLAEKSRLGKLAHFGASKIADSLAKHSLDNFYKK